MKIGIDASRANNLQKTGVEWYAYQIIEEFKKLVPKEIEVVLYTREPLQGKLAKLPSNWTQKVLKWPPKRFWTQIRLSLEMLLSAPDILFVPAHVFPLVHPKKTAMVVHDVAAFRFPQSYNWFERWYSLWSAKYAVKKLWKVITPSQFNRQEILDLVGSQQYSSKIFVIPHGCNFDDLVLTKADGVKAVWPKYKINKPYLISVGRLEEKKNTKRILEAFDRLKLHGFLDLKLVLVGLPGYGFESVREAINASINADDIVATGWVDQADLIQLVSGAEVLVFPSLYEGFGLPILEAMALGVPVVASYGSCLEEVGAEVPIYANPQSVSAIEMSIRRLLEDKNEAQARVDQGYKRVKSFTWAKSASQTLKLLVEE